MAAPVSHTTGHTTFEVEGRFPDTPDGRKGRGAWSFGPQVSNAMGYHDIHRPNANNSHSTDNTVRDYGHRDMDPSFTAAQQQMQAMYAQRLKDTQAQLQRAQLELQQARSAAAPVKRGGRTVAKKPRAPVEPSGNPSYHTSPSATALRGAKSSSASCPVMKSSEGYCQPAPAATESHMEESEAPQCINVSFDNKQAYETKIITMSFHSTLKNMTNISTKNSVPVNPSLFNEPLATWDETEQRYLPVNKERTVIVSANVLSYHNDFPKAITIGCNGFHKDGRESYDHNGSPINFTCYPNVDHGTGREIYEGKNNFLKPTHLSEYGQISSADIKKGVVKIVDSLTGAVDYIVPESNIAIRIFSKNKNRYAELISEERRFVGSNGQKQPRFVIPQQEYNEVVNYFTTHVADSFKFTDVTKLNFNFSILNCPAASASDLSNTIHNNASQAEKEKIINTAHTCIVEIELTTFTPRIQKAGDPIKLLYSQTPDGQKAAGKVLSSQN